MDRPLVIGARTSVRAVQHKTVAEAVADALRNRILSGDLPEGALLRQELLAQELGVSRIPLREAFRCLEAEGLVTIVPHRGTVVSAPAINEIAELFDLRAMIEPDLIERAVPQLSPADLRNAEHILAQYKAAFAQRDVLAWGTLNTQFHLALLRPSGRSRSLQLAQSLLDQTDRYTRMQLLLTGGQSRAQQEHTALLRACRKGNGDKAAELLRRHVLNAGKSLLHFLSTYQRPSARPKTEDSDSTVRV
jgi:DNA-binding GntR family transcriptional regulator